MFGFEQGDILKAERIKEAVLVVSKIFFNQSGQAMVRPIVSNAACAPLHIEIGTDEIKCIM